MCPKVLKLSSDVSDVFPKVLKLSSEVSECQPLVGGFQGERRRHHGALRRAHHHGYLRGAPEGRAHGVGGREVQVQPRFNPGSP